MTSRHAVLLLTIVASMGCGTTKWSDTQRTATEQLLVSDAIDRAVQKMNFELLFGKKVFFDPTYLGDTVDRDYLVSSIRQHLLASGCVLTANRQEADYVVEARAGAVGTDRHDLLYGLPATNLPSFGPLAGVPTSLPEIPLAKRTDQTGVAKLAVFAYERQTGRRVWQSGLVRHTSRAKDIWFLGAGPFQKRSDRDGTLFAGQRIRNPLVRRTPDVDSSPAVDVTAEAHFLDRPIHVASQPGDAEQHSPPSGPAQQPRDGGPESPPASPEPPVSLPPATPYGSTAPYAPDVPSTSTAPARPAP